MDLSGVEPRKNVPESKLYTILELRVGSPKSRIALTVKTLSSVWGHSIAYIMPVVTEHRKLKSSAFRHSS